MTNDSNVMLTPSTLPNVTPIRKPPMKRNIEPDQLDAFLKEDSCKRIDDFTEDHSPDGFCFRKDENSVIYYRLVFQIGIPKVKESINISSDLNVSLSYQNTEIFS